jgi:hypothetical protein
VTYYLLSPPPKGAVSQLSAVRDVTVQEAADRLSLVIVPAEAAANAPRWWWFEAFGIKVPCYNFEWRRQAIAHHDLHHVLTGYPMTLRGEMQVATWEFAAGRFPNVCSNLFCLPLVAAGCLVHPKGVWAAFRAGRHSRSLFSTPITRALLDTPLSELRSRFTQQRAAVAPWRDAPAFATLAALSGAWLLSPLLLVLLALAICS